MNSIFVNSSRDIQYDQAIAQSDLIAHGKLESYIPIRLSWYSSLEATYPPSADISWEIVDSPLGTFEDNPVYGNDIILPNFIYYPPEDPGYGLDQFAFRIVDNNTGNYSEPAIVNIKITPPESSPSWNIGGRVKTNSSMVVDVYTTKQYQNSAFDIVNTYTNEEVIGTIQASHFCDIWAQNAQQQFISVWRSYVLFDDGVVGWVDSSDLLISITPTPTTMKSQVTHWGITWYFDTFYPVGQFINSEPFVIGPVKVIDIDPKTIDDSLSKFQHGSMVNPLVDSDHGFDSNAAMATESGGPRRVYVPSLNVSLQLPNLNLNVNDVLVSCKSINPIETTKLQTVAALTVLGESPPINSFRPSIWGTDRSIKWNYSDINWNLLPNLTVPTSNDSRYYDVLYSDIVPYFLKPLPWFEWDCHYEANQFRARDNFSDSYKEYGREVASKFGLLGVWLACANRGNEAQRRDVAVKVIQNGIDIYDWFQNGGCALPDGGHNLGKKLPTVIAAALLEDTTIKTWLSANPTAFQEDGQLFYVSEADPYIRRYLPESDSWYGRRHDNYTPAMIGMPEWGVRHNRGTYTQNLTGWEQDEELKWDNAYWWAGYRDMHYLGMMGAWFAAKLLNIENVWANPVAFDYMERVFKLRGKPGGINEQATQFVRKMWDYYYVKSAALSATAGIPLVLHNIQNVSSQQQNFPATNLIDNNDSSDWRTPIESLPPHSVVVGLDKAYNVAGVDLRSTVASNDGHLTDFNIYTSLDNSTWSLAISSYTGGGDQTISVLFPSVSAKYVKLVALCTYGYPQGYPCFGCMSPSLNTSMSRLQVRRVYSDPLAGLTKLTGISAVQWSSEQVFPPEGGYARYAVDDNPSTFWHSRWTPNPIPNPPHWIVLDMGSVKTVRGLQYFPRPGDPPGNGTFQDYQIHVSNTLGNWGSPVASGYWSFDETSKSEGFNATGRYVRLLTQYGHGSDGIASAVQINLFQ